MIVSKICSDIGDLPRMITLAIIYIIQPGAKKKRNFFKINFPIFIFNKIHHIIYQIKHNGMNSMMLKTVSKNILR